MLVLCLSPTRLRAHAGGECRDLSRAAKGRLEKQPGSSSTGVSASPCPALAAGAQRSKTRDKLLLSRGQELSVPPCAQTRAACDVFEREHLLAVQGFFKNLP